MGCGGSRIETLDFVRERYPRSMAFLELSPYSGAFADLFSANDRNGDQKLAVSEFLKALKIARTRASVRLFSIVDMDGSGFLDFREMIFTIWHISTVDDRGLSDIVFDLYDEDTNGLIDPDDLYRLLVDCYGKAHMEKPEIEKMLKRAEEGGAMNRLQFAEFSKRSPQTMKQMIDIQLHVRETILGTKTWAIMEKKRKQKMDPAFQPVRRREPPLSPPSPRPPQTLEGERGALPKPVSHPSLPYPLSPTPHSPNPLLFSATGRTSSPASS
jgi:Ca2+-binding EF-hand superfamily protein